MLSCVGLVRTDVSDECIASILRVTRIGELVFLRSLLQVIINANVIPNHWICGQEF
jgi:hypothetical protein